MFRDVITFYNLGVGLARGVMTNVDGDSYIADDTFVITLRALLFNRIPSSDTLKFELKKISSNSSKVMETLLMEVPMIGKPNCFTVCYFDRNGTGAKSYFDRNGTDAKSFFEDSQWIFAETHDGYEKVDKITTFYQKSFGVAAYINRQTKSTVVFVDSFDLQRCHYLQLCILAAMPWYFDPAEYNPSPEVVNVLMAVRDRTPERYRNAISDLYKKIEEESGTPMTCPNCGKLGLRPAPYGNYFCEECYRLYKSSADNQLVEVTSGMKV